MSESLVSYALTNEVLDQFEAEIPVDWKGKAAFLNNLRKKEKKSRSRFPSGKGCYLGRDELKKLIEKYRGQVDLADQICRQLKPALTCKIPEGQEDFTCYFDRNGKDDEVERVLQYYQGPSLPKSKSKHSYECKITMWDNQPTKQRVLAGRALACPSKEGKKWSVTVRKDWDDIWHKDPVSPPEGKASVFLNNISEIGDLLYDLNFEMGAGKQQGLVIVAGKTAAGKSKIVRHLLGKYLQDRLKNISPSLAKKPRKPHVLTHEDPIEKYFNQADNELIKEVIEQLDYTPRQMGLDVGQLKETLNDALRQTPTVLFVGETRALDDWKQLLHFAGTGHLVITTTHAGSLTEAMGNILRAAKSLQPRARSVVADRLLGVIHLRCEKVKETEILIPALWRYTPNGAKALMAEGLASLLPNVPEPLPPEKRSIAKIRQFPSSIGRYWFACELTELSRRAPILDEVLTIVKQKAFEWDLEGI